MNIVNIIIRKLSGDLLTEQEQLYFDWWIQSDENRSLFYRLQRMDHRERELYRVLTLDEETSWERVLERLNAQSEQNKKHISLPSFLKYAATALVILSAGIGVWHIYQPAAPHDKYAENAITLQLENGEVKVIVPEAVTTITNAKGTVVGRQKGSQLDYFGSTVDEELSYNTLTVPYGKRFVVVLSDSTLVHLNAGSSLRYPTHFQKGQNRQVSLTGEGYFDVYSDKKHPFVVTTGDVDVRVLGTRFSISAYPEDQQINTVLVEGSVSLYSSAAKYDKETAALLEPGYKAEWDKTDKALAFEKVNTDFYTDWVEGKLVVHHASFKNIVKKLERHYNVSIKSNYPKLDDQIFTATFDIETIEDVLRTFSEETPFEFQIDDQRLITISAPQK